MNQHLYLDYAAATPMDVRVCTAMSEFLASNNYANPSAPHKLGVNVKQIVEKNRTLVADLIGACNNEIIWTSGATESNNLALIGAALAYKHVGNHIITLATEHESILKTCNYLEKIGFHVTCLVPNKDGRIDNNKLRESITSHTILASIMLVNNETGVIQDIKNISEITQNKGVLLHVDAAQAAGKLDIDVKKLGINLMSISAHKMYGPKGIGALYIDSQSNIELHPVLHGGAQENGIRPGTLATHQIVGFGEASLISKEKHVSDFNHAIRLREIFISLTSKFLKFNFPFENTSPYIINICFPDLSEIGKKKLGVSSELILSSRSACSSHNKKSISHVLQSLGFSKEIIQNSYRISTGRYTTEEEIIMAASMLKYLCRQYT